MDSKGGEKGVDLVWSPHVMAKDLNQNRQPCVFCPIFLPLFLNPFRRRFVLAEWLNPFWFFFSLLFGRTLGRTLTGCWSLAHGNCLFKRAPLSFNGICKQGSAEERKINLKKAKCETKAKQMPRVITGAGKGRGGAAV